MQSLKPGTRPQQVPFAEMLRMRLRLGEPLSVGRLQAATTMLARGAAEAGLVNGPPSQRVNNYIRKQRGGQESEAPLLLHGSGTGGAVAGARQRIRVRSGLIVGGSLSNM